MIRSIWTQQNLETLRRQNAAQAHKFSGHVIETAGGPRRSTEAGSPAPAAKSDDEGPAVHQLQR